MALKRLTLTEWRQFGSVEVDFHPRLTILTGSNGAGKTTILNILSQLWNWQFQFVSTPLGLQAGTLRYSQDRRPISAERLGRIQERIRAKLAQLPSDSMGTLEFADGSISSLSTPINQAQYSIIFAPPRNISGLSIPSHRPLFHFQQAQKIQAFGEMNALYDRYSGAVRSRILGAQAESPSLALKESLISLALQGPGNVYVEPNQAAIEAFEGFQQTLHKVLPPTLKFRKLKVRMPEIVLETDTGDFTLDAVSGGIATLVDLAWRIFIFSKSHLQFVVTIDEPENHLHPEMQKSVLPGLVEAFPNVQFVVATHSPFIVSAIPDSHVYALRYEQNKVEAVFLQDVDKAGTANEILREVLGLEFTMPLWADNRLRNIVEKYANYPVTSQTLTDLRAELSSIGLASHIPQATADVISEGNPG